MPRNGYMYQEPSDYPRIVYISNFKTEREENEFNLTFSIHSHKNGLAFVYTEVGGGFLGAKAEFRDTVVWLK